MAKSKIDRLEFPNGIEIITEPGCKSIFLTKKDGKDEKNNR